MIRMTIVVFAVLWVTDAVAAPVIDYISFFGTSSAWGESRIALGPAGYAVALTAHTHEFPSPSPDAVAGTGSAPYSGYGAYIGSFDAQHEWLAGLYIGDGGWTSVCDLEVLPSGDLIVALSAAGAVPFHQDYAVSAYAWNIYVLRLSRDLLTIRWSTRLGSAFWTNEDGRIRITGSAVAVSWFGSDVDEFGGPIYDHGTAILNLEDGTLSAARNWGTMFLSVLDRFPDGDLLLAGSCGDIAPITAGVYQPAYGGHHTDGVLMKITPDFTVVWCTYLGDPSADHVSAACVLPDGSTVFGLRTSAGELPLQDTAWNHESPGLAGSEIYLARLAPDASDLVWGGYLGGGDHDGVVEMHADDTGRIIMGVRTDSVDFPTTTDAPHPANSCTHDRTILAKMNGFSGELEWSTYLGEATYATLLGMDLSQGRFAATGVTASWYEGEPPAPTPDAYDPVAMDVDNYILLATDADLVPLEENPPLDVLPLAPTLEITARNGSVISFRVDLPRPAAAAIKVHDLRGRTIAVVHAGALPAGPTDLEWSGRTATGNAAPRGAYSLTLHALDCKASRMIMIR